MVTSQVFGTDTVGTNHGVQSPHRGDVSSDLAFVSSRTGVDVSQWQAMAG